MLGNVNQGKNKTSHWVSVCVLLLCEWVNEVQVCWGNKGWWVNGDSCVIGVMVDGNVCVQCMMGDVVHGWCAVEVSGNQIHDTYDFCDVENADRIAESNHKKRNLLYKVECHRIWKVGNYT